MGLKLSLVTIKTSPQSVMVSAPLDTSCADYHAEVQFCTVLDMTIMILGATRKGLLVAMDIVKKLLTHSCIKVHKVYQICFYLFIEPINLTHITL